MSHVPHLESAADLDEINAALDLAMLDVTKDVPTFAQLSALDRSLIVSRAIDSASSHARRLAELCKQLPALRPLINGWIQTESFGHAVQPHMLPGLLLRQAVDGHDTREIVVSAIEFAADGRSHREIYAALAGIAVDREVDLSTGLTIVPWSSVPNDEQKQAFDRGGFDPTSTTLGPFARLTAKPTSALRAMLEPTQVLFRTAQEANPNILGERRAAVDVVYENMADALRCMIAYTGRPLGFLGSWSRLRNDTARRLMGHAYGYGDALFDHAVLRTSEAPTVLDAEPIRTLCRQFHLMNPKDRRVLRIAIDRFSSALRETRIVDKAIDLGIALEVLLLHDTSAGKGARDRGELKFRTAIRGSAFVGGSRLERVQTMRVLKKAYDHRSAAVHVGELDKIDSATKDVELGLRLGLTIARRLIEMGRFPAWDEECVVGGAKDDQATSRWQPFKPRTRTGTCAWSKR